MSSPRTQPRGPRRKLALETSPTGYEGVDDAIIKAAVAQFRNLLCQNWTEIKSFGANSKSGKCAFSASFKVANGGKKASVQGKIRFAQSVTDEAEQIVEDPDQLKLPGVEGGDR